MEGSSMHDTTLSEESDSVEITDEELNEILAELEGELDDNKNVIKRRKRRSLTRQLKLPFLNN